MTTLSFSLMDGRNEAVIYMVLIALGLEMPLCGYFVVIMQIISACYI